MADISGFDANQVEPNEGFDLLPIAEYVAFITESELKSTQSGDGAYLKFTFQICEGKYQNRKLWLNLNTKNPNPETVAIAKGQLSAICRAVGVMTPKDTSELHNKAMRISVGQRKNKKSGNLENCFNGFKPRNAGPQVQAAQSAVPTSGPAATAGAPW